jgi:hypothetical protein
MSNVQRRPMNLKGDEQIRVVPFFDSRFFTLASFALDERNGSKSLGTPQPDSANGTATNAVERYCTVQQTGTRRGIECNAIHVLRL